MVIIKMMMMITVMIMVTIVVITVIVSAESIGSFKRHLGDMTIVATMVGAVILLKSESLD